MPDPLISVIIPTRDRPDQLAKCIEALAGAVPPPGGFEVIVVDDGGPAPTAPAPEAFPADLTVRVIRQPQRGPGAARNAGAAGARGRWLAFIDDDCLPTAGWLRALVAQFRKTPDALLGGRVVNALTDNPYATASQLITTYSYSYYDRTPQAERFFTTNNFALAAEALHRLGGFNESFPSATAEDKEFCDRWRRAGGRLQSVPDAVVHHAHALTLLGYLRQHHNYGRGIFCFRATRPNDGRRRVRPEPYRFYFDLIVHPLRGTAPRRWLYAGLILVSQVATISGAVRALLFDLPRLRAHTQGRAAEPA